MSNQTSPVIMRFDNVSFAYDEKKVILEYSDFSIRENTKITIMGQNGAGKSTIFKMILGEIKPQVGNIHIAKDKKIAISRQVIPRDQLDLTVSEWFATAFHDINYQLDRDIAKVLEEVSLVNTDHDKKLRDFSGWQQARLLLAYALIQNPDILLLDEPTNNLDWDGIGNLIWFLLWYDKTVVVISHDADFLNMFTDGVLYLNVHLRKVEQFWWDYYDAVEQIARQIERDEMNNARMEKEIQDKKDKVNFFANKWGKMRKLASKFRDDIEDAEDSKVEVRRDDKTITSFEIPFENLNGPIVTINNVSLMGLDRQPESHKLDLELRKWDRVLLKWPNGIGKTTLLRRLVNAHDGDATIHDDVRVGYYSQDFNALDMDMVVWDALREMSEAITDQDAYRVAAQFLLKGETLKWVVSDLSEGQKGLLCYARFVIQQPHLLILDEPTNHINFRHLPVIAEAISNYKGAIIMVSHDQAFVDQLDDVKIVDLGRLRK
jgi:ATP-binding cassette, subfamily F, member 3